MSDARALGGRIRENLKEIQSVVDPALQLSEKAIRTGDEDYWEGAALNLHNFYGGIERIFEDIARSFDVSLPSGPDWHRSLSMQMAADSHGIRPPVISPETRILLEEYRGFRHLMWKNSISRSNS